MFIISNKTKEVRREDGIILLIYFYYFGDKNYEARDYNKNKCFFLSECDFKKRVLKNEDLI